MDSKMTPEYKVISEQVEKIIKGSNLPEVQKYSLLAGCMTKVAHEYNGTNFEAIKVKLALVSKTMLNAVEKAEHLLSIFFATLRQSTPIIFRLKMSRSLCLGGLLTKMAVRCQKTVAGAMFGGLTR